MIWFLGCQQQLVEADKVSKEAPDTATVQSEEAHDSATFDDDDSALELDSSIRPQRYPVELVQECFDQNSNLERSVHVLHSYQLLIEQEGGTVLFDEATGTQTFVSQSTKVDGLVYQNSRLVLVEGKIYLWEEELELLELNQLIEVPIERIETDGERLYLYGFGRLFVLFEGRLTEIRIDGVSHIFNFTFSSTGELWLTDPWTLSLDSSLSATNYDARWPADDLFFDGKHLWIQSSGELWSQREGQEISLDFDAPVVQIKGSSKDGRLWIGTEQGVIVAHKGSYYEVDLPVGVWKDVDDHGRLLVQTEVGLCRYSIDRPVVWVGLEDRPTLRAQDQLALIPTAAQDVVDLRAYLGSEPLEVDADPWRVHLDPDAFPSGVHSLRFVIEGEERIDVDEASVYFEVLPQATWEADVLPIAQQRCFFCHSGATITPLSESQQWSSRIDEILDLVSEQIMPPGGPYLSEEEILILRGWENGGFE